MASLMYGISRRLAMNPGMSLDVEISLPIWVASLHDYSCTSMWFSGLHLKSAEL